MHCNLNLLIHLLTQLQHDAIEKNMAIHPILRNFVLMKNPEDPYTSLMLIYNKKLYKA